MDLKTEAQLRQELGDVWALLDAERASRQDAQRRLEAMQEDAIRHQREMAQAVAAERERCAQVCEGFGGNGSGYIDDDWAAMCAAAIRRA